MTYTKIHFTIQGNHEDPKGNPIPFERAVKGHWRTRSTRYMNWQAYVRSEYKRQEPRDIGGPIIFKKEGKPTKRMLTEGYQVKPFKLENTKIYVHSKICFRDRTHGDSDNVQKGIIDSLFTQDKYIAGSYDFEYGEKGKVEVEIVIKNTIK